MKKKKKKKKKKLTFKLFMGSSAGYIYLGTTIKLFQMKPGIVKKNK